MTMTREQAIMQNVPHPDLEKFECGDCGCYYWIEIRNDFYCPNCTETIVLGE